MGLGALAVGLVLVAGATRLGSDRPDLETPVVTLDASPIETADAALGRSGHVLTTLVGDAEAVLVGAWLAGGTIVDGGWRFDHPASASGSESVSIERVALAASRAGSTYERIGESLNVAGSPPSVAGLTSDDQRQEALALVVELTGDLGGRLARVPADRGSVVRSLARSLGLSPSVEAGGDEAVLTLDRLADRLIVAGWRFGCLDRVPLVGGRGCSGVGSGTGAPSTLAAVDRSVLDSPWRIATTDSFRPGADRLPAESGGVSWNNREAQAYGPAGVAIGSTGIGLTATARSTPDIDELPFESGMVVSDATYGWGRFEVDVALPTGTGLWPAVWLLDATACAGPGRCPGYESTDYHEIDLIETTGDDTAVSTVHWFESDGVTGRFRSSGGQRTVSGLADGSAHTVALDRRPGLLVWSVDGVEIHRLAGPAEATDGPHRAGEMRLVLNLAVGGSFAGDRLVGRDGGWWGDARVPAGFPDQGWSEASMLVSDVRFTPLDEDVLRR